MTALVLGNGKSRKEAPPIKFALDGPAYTYGCNAIYRDETVDYLVSMDPAMQHEIYSSGYCRENPCYFNEWAALDGAEARAIKQLGFPYTINENKKQSVDLCNIAGRDSEIFITWLDDKEDRVVSIDWSMSAGAAALRLAALHGHKKIYMMGFDIDDSNVFEGTECYENSRSLDEWYEEHQLIYEEFPQTKFIQHGCRMDWIPLDNVIRQ